MREPNIERTHFIIDPGHGGSDVGARLLADGRRLYEKNLMLAVGLFLGGFLVDAGMQVSYSRTADSTMSNTTRVGAMNAIDAHCVISLHTLDEPSEHFGIVSYARENESYLLARFLAEQLSNEYSPPSMATNGNDRVLLKTYAPAVMVEAQGMDEGNLDFILEVENQVRYAKVLSAGLLEGLKRVTWKS